MTMRHDDTDPARRAFLLGRLGQGASPETQAEHHISSFVVHALPDAAEKVSEAIAALGDVEIHARDPSGKLILTLESADDDTIVTRLSAIQAIPGVLSAALVFHHVEEAGRG